jgi:RNA 2',3'-cyclic 3'-phosphodiesterase
MRLFAAVEIDERVRSLVADVAMSIQKALARTGLDARWVPPANMHLTVRFIGHVPDQRVAELTDAIRAPVTLAPFTIALDACGAFPPSGPPRVIWIGLRQGLDALRAIAAEMDRRVVPFGFEPERRPFSAHVTLARIKAVPHGAGALVRQAVLAARVPEISWAVTHATLFESHLSPRGPSYEVVARIPLDPQPT